jgi:hypothetical protein
MIEGIQTEVASWGISFLHQIYIDIKWGFIRVQTTTGPGGNDVLLIGEVTVPDPVINLGYIGWNAGTSDGPGLTIYNFAHHNWDQHIGSQFMIKQMLAMGDYHDVVVGGPNGKQAFLVWGPQTDIRSPADALRQLLDAEKLDLVWRDGVITVGQFTATAPIRTLQNELISTEYMEEAARRLNLVIVDGNEHSWFEADGADSRIRDRQIVGYFDIPELATQSDVRNRATEELRRSAAGQSPGALLPLQFDLWRMDPITIIDSLGDSKNVRIEGIRVTINQSTEPSQREELDTSLIV